MKIHWFRALVLAGICGLIGVVFGRSLEQADLERRRDSLSERCGQLEKERNAALIEADRAKARCTAAAEPVPHEWRKVGTWDVARTRTTERFDVQASAWRIAWSVQPARGEQGAIAIAVYRPDRSLVKKLRRREEDGFGSSAGIYWMGSELLDLGPGGYFLEITIEGDQGAVWVEDDLGPIDLFPGK